jgi:hypothetical protein
MKYINAWQAAFSALVIAAACATGCAASDDGTAAPVDESAAESAAAVTAPAANESAVTAPDWTLTPDGATSNARQNGDCCNANCTNGFHGVNLPLTSGCDAWAESFCRNAWAPPQRLVKAYWGGC